MLIHPKEPYEKAKASLGELCSRVVDQQSIVVIERNNGKNVALISEDELSSMEETIYLLSFTIINIMLNSRRYREKNYLGNSSIIKLANLAAAPDSPLIR
jgi:PHD/YefM family antitoxin component YafN of YafNO toxin-antitoxin module